MDAVLLLLGQLQDCRRLRTVWQSSPTCFGDFLQRQAGGLEPKEELGLIHRAFVLAVGVRFQGGEDRPILSSLCSLTLVLLGSFLRILAI